MYAKIRINGDILVKTGMHIGGSGSRGYGKIAFENIIAETVVGEVSEELLAQCNKILSQAIQE